VTKSCVTYNAVQLKIATTKCVTLQQLNLVPECHKLQVIIASFFQEIFWTGKRLEMLVIVNHTTSHNYWPCSCLLQKGLNEATVFPRDLYIDLHRSPKPFNWSLGKNVTKHVKIWFNLSTTTTLETPKIVAVVDRWSLFIGTALCYKHGKREPQNGGRCRQVITIRRWLLAQVWLFQFDDQIF